ncbi:MAG: nucleotide sugar dehydrogenase [Bacteroidota bacterium]
MNDVCVIGLGYIGLPTAALLANNGMKVTGVDNNEEVIDTIRKGNVHIDEAGLRTLVQAAVRSGMLEVSLTPTESEAFIIAVPTPIQADTRPDLTHVFDAVALVCPVLKAGDLLIVESTVPPGTTETVARFVKTHRPDLIQNSAIDGLKIDVAHCPERVLPGRILKELVENDRVVGGITPQATNRAAQLYNRIVSASIHKTSATTAEMVKLAENTFRDVNIALANEMALMCEKSGIDAWEVIGLANHHPRVNYLRPGPGVGGHCIAVDPWVLVSQFPDETKVIRSSRERNDSMPGLVVSRALELVGDVAKPKVACLGLSYKGNVGDARSSPAIQVYEGLIEKVPQGSVVVHDPHVAVATIPLSSLEDAIAGSDLLIILTDHDEYRYIDPIAAAQKMRRRLIYDTRHVIEPAAWMKAGFTVEVLGQRRREAAGAVSPSVIRVI